jgi:hypothetical protein
MRALGSPKTPRTVALGRNPAKRYVSISRRSVRIPQPCHVFPHRNTPQTLIQSHFPASQLAFFTHSIGRRSKIQILKRDGDHYGLVRDVVLDDSAKEIDVEGIACDGNTVYVVGSHSWKRESVKDNNTYKDNRELIAAIQPEPSRDRVFKFTVDSEGNTSAIEKTSLRAILDQDKVLHPFSRVPSKENGIDIEGLAFHQGLLYAGFRGPVL